MRKGNSVDWHMAAEGTDLSSAEDWNSGQDIPYPFLEGLEEYISDVVEESNMDPDEPMIQEVERTDDNFFDLDILSGEDEEIDFASREEVLEFADEIYDSFEEVFDLDIPEEVRDEWKDNTVYDEGLGFKLGKTVKRSEFLYPILWSLGGALAGISANSYRAWDMREEMIENGTDLMAVDEAYEQALGLNDEIAMGALGLGIAYGLKNSYPAMKSQFTGKFLNSKPSLIKSLDLGGRDPLIAINPDKKSKTGAFYTGVAENLHMLQEAMNSPTSYDPLLNEGMDIFAKYLVGKEMEESNTVDTDHLDVALGIRNDKLLEAYGILKNNGGYMVDDDTFIDLGLDPEESKRMANDVEKHMARDDRSDEQLFGYSIGGAYLIMEYEKGNIDPAEVLREGRDAMPDDFQKVYETALMENI